MAVPNVLTIAGSDPSGGAGVQADLKAMSALGVFATTVLTALTAQNTRAVTGVFPVPPAFVAEQLETLMADVELAAVKVGMVASKAIAEVVAAGLNRLAGCPVVVDPVMVSKSGHRLLAADAEDALRRTLLPRATLVTPNLPEAAVLLGAEEPRTLAGMGEMARALGRTVDGAVLLKGGHLPEAHATDVLWDGRDLVEIPGPRIDTTHTHGTGCTLSSAIAARLALGDALLPAVRAAKAYLEGALRHADALRVGSGHGPVHHFHAVWAAARAPLRS